MKNIIRLMIGLSFLILATSGCSTMEGLGQDLQGLGNKIENKASSNVKKDEAKTESVPTPSGVVVTPIK